MIAPSLIDTGMQADETLDDLRARLAPLIAANAGFDGWSARAVGMAAAQAGVDADIAALAFKDGAMAMLANLTPEALAAMKIRARITALVTARLMLLAPHREALRRAQTILAMPQNLAAAAKLGWHAADAMWRAAGDTATDYNHYTKRATLGAVYAATLLTFVNDESEDFAETRAFLARRIEDIMRFEKAKARLAGQSDMHFSPARFLGRLRERASQR